jgi:PAS domain S-box-containing protein
VLLLRPQGVEVLPKHLSARLLPGARVQSKEARGQSVGCGPGEQADRALVVVSLLFHARPWVSDQRGLSAKEQLFDLVVESSLDIAIFTIDADGKTTSWNVGAERLFGYSEAEMLGASADAIFTKEDRAAGVPEREKSAAATFGRALDERWHQRKDGSRFWASGLLMTLRGANPGFAKIARDRTEQHLARERLRENEQRFRLLATSIPQLVFLTRPDGSRTWPSPQWIIFTGMSFEESLGFGWLDAVHPEDREATERAWIEAREKGEYYVEHRVQRARDKAYLWHQTRAKPLENAAASDWVGTMTDIDDLRGLQSRQHVLMAELQHRTRNLLAVVQSIANQTLRTSRSLEVFGSQFGSRLQALSRVQSLLARVEDQAIDLHALVAAELAAHDHADPAESSKVTVGGPSVALPASAAQALGLALHELATNAVKYGALAQPNGKLAVTWTLAEEHPAATVALEWHESGVSMQNSGPPKRKGYGSKLIEEALPYQLGAKTKLDFQADGVRCAIVVPIQRGTM